MGYHFGAACPQIVLEPRSIYPYSNLVPRLLGQTSISGVVFLVSKSLLGIGESLFTIFASLA